MLKLSVSFMTEIYEITECADCGCSIDGDPGATDVRKLCSACGSIRRIYNISIKETLIARNGYVVKTKRPSQKKPYIEDLSMPDYSYSRSKHVHRQRIIDRENDHYFEEITDYETGEVIHHCEEPLSQHQGHGDAKNKNNQG